MVSHQPPRVKQRMHTGVVRREPHCERWAGGREADGRNRGCLQVSEEKDDERDLQYTFQQALSSEHTQSSEFTHVMLCYIVGKRNLSSALPFGSCPHLWLKCRTPSIFFLSSPLPVVGMSASSTPTSCRTVNDPTA